MIRLLHTIDTTGPGGAEKVFMNLINGLDNSIFEPIVAIPGPGWVCDELNKNGIKPFFFNSRGAFSLSYLRDLVSIIRRNKIDLIQTHLLGSNLYCSIAGKLCNVPVVSTFHGFVDIKEKERFLKFKSKIINLGSDRTIYVSNHLKEYFIENICFSKNKAATIYNGINISIFKPQEDDTIRRKFGIKCDNILVGAVGNIRHSKGYKYLLEAAKLVVDKYPEFRFVIAGEGSGDLLQELMMIRKSLHLEDHFFFSGFEADIPQFLNNLDIFIVSSVSEGFSISAIEAMACGLPVIATRSGGPEEIISHLENGILTEVCSCASIYESIIKVYEDKNLRKKIINAGIKHVKEHYTDEAMVMKYVEQYLNILQN